MKRPKLNFKIDWKAIIIELLIVIIGISIAFKLNNWNESKKTELEVKEYIRSFYDENHANQESLISALKFTKSNKTGIDTLKVILLSKNKSDERIKSLIANMMGIANYTPLTTTMQNISSSGEFDLIKDIELRKDLIETYSAYKRTAKLETIISDYINDYVTPFLFENLLFSDFSYLNGDFIKDPIFENIVIGYDVLLNQLINGYEQNLIKLNELNEKLTTANKVYNK
jgi:hypothetical protein